MLLTWGIGPVMAGGEEYEKIDRPLSIEEGNNVRNIPSGSVIRYLADGTTEIHGPDKALILKAKDSEAKPIATPVGLLKANHIHHVPDGTFIKSLGNADKVYLGDKCVLTVIDEGRDEREDKRLPSSPPPAFHGWIEWAEDISVSYCDYFYARWWVPQDPDNPNYYAINYIFNGIVPDDATAIIQPVLEWNYNDSGDWTCAAWYVIGSTGYRSGDINADAGDEIRGTMNYYDESSQWNISIRNQTDSTWKSIQTDYFDDEGLKVYVALEGYWVYDNGDICSDINFRSMDIRNNQSGITVTWDDQFGQGSGLTGLDVVYDETPPIDQSWVDLLTDGY